MSEIGEKSNGHIWRTADTLCNRIHRDKGLSNREICRQMAERRWADNILRRGQRAGALERRCGGGWRCRYGVSR